jgi:superfamily II DNA or RNA helicase
MLRKHQSETEAIFRKMAAGLITDKFVLCKVEPGGGKSALPGIAGKELIYKNLAERLCWVVPRKSLQDQGERSFEDPFFRQLLGHFLSVRSSTNEIDPCRDEDGIVTTYQAIGMDKAGILQDEFKRHRYILILDEFHHVEQDGTWHGALAPLVESAEKVLLMTGTLERGDGKAIAFAPYRDSGGDLIADLKKPGYQVVNYDRQDALLEKAILPLVFHLSDASASWSDENGKINEVSSLSTANRKDVGPAVFTALSTEFATTLLKQSIAHWENHRKKVPHAKHLVVTANFEAAKKHTEWLRRRGYNVEIATSHDSPAAHKAILRYKRSEIDIIVSIAMAYEGLDVPEISHISSLTHIRSIPWIIQMLARAVRIDKMAGPYESQAGYIFAPDDMLFRRIVARIKEEQLSVVKKQKEKNESSKKEIKKPQQQGLFGSGNIYGIKPRESKLTDARELDLDGHNPVPEYVEPARIKTKTEQELELKKRIDQRIKRFEYVNCYRYGRINTELKQKFGKGRGRMTLAELKMMWNHIQQAYPISGTANYQKQDGISGPRGHGRRAPTKAQEWTGPVNIPVFGGAR